MKRIILLLGYVFLGFIMLLAAGTVFLMVTGSKLDKESKLYVDAALPAIIAEWDIREVQKRASPGLRSNVDYAELQHSFKMLRKLGKLEAYNESSGNANIAVSLWYDYEITADYKANAEFERGTADIDIMLIKEGGSWLILNLYINPAVYGDRHDII